MDTRTLTCSDGHILVYRTWIPQKREIRAVLHIFHGMAEHASRYDRFATFLNTHGIAVYAQDHRGHGDTAVEGELGWFADEDGWLRVAEDAYELSNLIATENPGLQLFLMGHSMGSFLARTVMVLHPDLYSGVIIMGSGAAKGALGKVGMWLAKRHAKKNGFRTPDKAIDKLSFGSFNKRFSPAKTPFDWLSRDEAEVQKYIDDELCGFVCSSQFFVDLLTGVEFANNRANAERLPKDLPLLVISGDMDPVGDYGKGVRKVYALYRDAGIADVTLKLIPGGRHELLNETNRDEIQQELYLWINRRIED